MNFSNRLKFYVFGLGIGILISYMFFGNRGCGKWLPGNRVKSAIMDFQWLSNSQTDCQLSVLNFYPSKLASFIENSSVDFNKSQTDTDPRIYHLNSENQEIIFAVSFTDSTVFVNSFGGSLKSKASSCDTIKKNKYLPIEKTLRELIKK